MEKVSLLCVLPGYGAILVIWSNTAMHNDILDKKINIKLPAVEEEPGIWLPMKFTKCG